MYEPYREDSQVNIKLPWEKNTARGFGISLSIVLFMIFLIPQCRNIVPDNNVETNNLIPIDIINFGAGDGTGVSKGNLSKEGELHKGQKLSSELHDAAIAAAKSQSKNIIVEDPENYSNLEAAKDIASNAKNNKDNAGTASTNIGSQNGSPNGTGTGNKGFGPGAGQGLGDIEWGGGGNRTVLIKKLPKYPPGSNTEAQIRIKFTVTQDGTVRSMLPLQRGDPSLERAAMDALKQWRFNPLRDNREMVGIITFTFKLS